MVGLLSLLSIRFFFKYVDPPWLGYGLYVSAAVAVCVGVLRSSRFLGLVTRPWVFVLALASLFVMVLVAYPRADALRAVGRGSDQDDCVRTLVANVFARREPYGFGYFGDPCSTGPTEFFVYFPVQISSSYFMIVPVLSTLLGYWVLTQVTDRQTAILLSLTQLASWLFLEMSAIGSDMIVIAWLFAAATVASCKGIRDRNTALTIVGGVAFCLFAGSRVPLIVVAAGSLWVLLVVFRARALRVVLPVTLVTAAFYLGTYAAAPSSFTPGHLGAKSVNILRYLGGGDLTAFLVGMAVLLVVLAIASLRADSKTFVQRHYFAANLLAITLPMAAVAVWDLSRRGFSPAEWEGLNYLFLCVPSLLVAVGSWLRARAHSVTAAPP